MTHPTPPTSNRILIIDDNRSIHEDFRKILEPRGEKNPAVEDTKALLFGEEPTPCSAAEFELDSAFQGQEGLLKVQAALNDGRPYALAFVDVRMPPGWDGVETIMRIWKHYPDLQIVICTAYSDYSWQEMIDQLGKSDNLVILKKPFDNIEVLQLAHALTRKWMLGQQIKSRMQDLDQLVSERTSELRSANEKLKREIAERLQVEKALQSSEERFSKAFKASPIPLAIQSLRDERYLDSNQGFQHLTGYGREELLGHTPAELGLWHDPKEHEAVLESLQRETSVRNLHARLRSKPGQVREILLSLEMLELDGEPFLLTIAQDLTEQIQLETQLRQSQKMEAIGQLAAGVAHDFNNLLTVVHGHAGLLLARQPPESAERKPLQTICAAAERASKLVRQLLTFSRKQFIQAQTLDIRDTVLAVSELLPRLLGEDIQVELVAPQGLPAIHADAAMMEQLLMNLALNARDAITRGGQLTIKAEAIEISPVDARHNPEARPGQFVCLSVSDNGCGMPPELLPRIFEPFFTTKPIGKGTGLGLATVYGIVKQHQGWIEVQSQVGRGSTFRVFFPVSTQRAEPAAAPPFQQRLRGGSETILVVEDEEDVRDFVAMVLTSHGYEVCAAASGTEALERWAEQKDRIDLLLTDMVMPGGLTGRDLAERLLAERPDLPVIYTSGYSPGLTGQELALLEGSNFLAKPYGPPRLLRVVRGCLDQHQRVVAGAAKLE